MRATSDEGHHGAPLRARATNAERRQWNVSRMECDGLAEGFRTIAVKEAIGDRVPGAVAWNLYDIDAKFADVETVETCVNYLNTVNAKSA